MSKNLIKSISKIVEESGTHKITIFTNHLKIDGQMCFKYDWLNISIEKITAFSIVQ